MNFRAAQFSDAQAQELWNQRPVSIQEVPQESILKVVELYLAIRELILEIGGVCAAGANCLNESFYSATTPCLVWNWLFEYDHIIWVCEGDTVTLISKFILYFALKTPMMTNIYPFLAGVAALKHEKFSVFPALTIPTATCWDFTADILASLLKASARNGSCALRYWTSSAMTPLLSTAA